MANSSLCIHLATEWLAVIRSQLPPTGLPPLSNLLHSQIVEQLIIPLSFLMRIITTSKYRARVCVQRRPFRRVAHSVSFSSGASLQRRAVIPTDWQTFHQQFHIALDSARQEWPSSSPASISSKAKLKKTDTNLILAQFK